MKPGVAQSCHCRWCWQICPSSRGVQGPEQGRRMPCSSSQGSVWSVLLAAWIASACRSEASSSSTSSSSIPRPHTHPSSTTAAKLLPEALWVISCRREAGMGQGSVGKTSPEGAGKEDFTQVPRELGKALRSFSMMSSRHMLTSWVLASTSSAVGRRAGGYERLSGHPPGCQHFCRMAGCRQLPAAWKQGSRARSSAQAQTSPAVSVSGVLCSFSFAWLPSD